MGVLTCVAVVMLAAEPLTPGEHYRTIEVNGQERSYHVHVPPGYDADRPTPVVLALHGAMTNAPIMALSSGLTQKADKAGFVAVYPNGTGKNSVMLVWNSGGLQGRLGKELPDDVAFIEKLLDDLATVINVDPKRVYATGISNGGMMCYRLAAELSDRIAAIAPVSGTLNIDKPRLKRPVPVIHFHGTADTLVRYEGPDPLAARFFRYQSVDQTIKLWAGLDGCPSKPTVTALPDTADDGTTVERFVYGPSREGSEVILYKIQEGGHTWPGRIWPLPLLGKTTQDISANDLIWEFFEKHPMK